MENTPKKVAKPGLQLVISVLVATSLILAELYVMINQPANVVLMIGIAVLVLIAVYFVIDAVMDCVKEKEIVTREQYDNIYRSEKASYMLLKKNLEEISHLIQKANENVTPDNTEEIINAQKALAKVSVSKNRESAEMIATKVVELERMLESSLSSVKTSGVDEEKQDRLFIELNNLEASLNDRLQGLSDKLSGFQEEIERLADHIARINTEAIAEAMNTAAVAPREKEIVLNEEIPTEEVTDDIIFTDLDMGDITIVEESDELGLSAFADESSDEEDDIAALLEETFEESSDDVVEEDFGELLGDVLDTEDVLIESDEDVLSQLLEAEEAVKEEEVDALAELAKAVDEVPVVESIPEPIPTPVPAAMPADNGGKMGQDDIAALIASMTGGD